MGSLNCVIQQDTYYYFHTASLPLWVNIIGPNTLLEWLDKMLSELCFPRPGGSDQSPACPDTCWAWQVLSVSCLLIHCWLWRWLGASAINAIVDRADRSVCPGCGDHLVHVHAPGDLCTQCRLWKPWSKLRRLVPLSELTLATVLYTIS